MMNTDTVTPILTQLKNTNSRNEKIKILEDNKDNLLLKKLFELTYSDTNLGIKDIDISNLSMEKSMTNNGHIELVCEIVEILPTLKPNSIEIKEYINNISRKLSYGGLLLLKDVIKKDLRCGVTKTTFRKVWEQKDKKIEVSLCNTLNEKTEKFVKFPCYVQEKFDGARTIFKVSSDDVSAFTRNNKPLRFGQTLNNELIRVFSNLKPFYDVDYMYFDGEVLYDNTENRKTSNGFYNKLVRDTATEDERNNFIAVIWDYYFEDDNRPYKKRLLDLMNSFDIDFNKLRLVRNQEVNNFDEIHKISNELMSQGKEGVIVKNKDFIWQGKRTNDQLKVKAELECDLKIVDIKEGTGKYQGKLGAFICESKDGKLQVNVGSGYSDEFREKYFDKEMIGKIITVKYNEVIKDKSSDIQSLFLPRFVSLRLDKDEADTLNKILEI